MNLTERARRLYFIARKSDEENGVDLIKAMLRVTRQEGIRVGLDQKDRFGPLLERKSA